MGSLQILYLYDAASQSPHPFQIIFYGSIYVLPFVYVLHNVQWHRDGANYTKNGDGGDNDLAFRVGRCLCAAAAADVAHTHNTFGMAMQLLFTSLVVGSGGSQFMWCRPGIEIKLPANCSPSFSSCSPFITENYDMSFAYK